MTKTLSKINLHLIFSTKNRIPCLDESIHDGLWRCMASTLIQHGCQPFQIGGWLQHVHLSFNLSREVTIANLVKSIKLESSLWIKEQGPQYANFRWQNGYGIFSFSPSILENVISYIQHQKQHHTTLGHTFEDEMVDFCRKANIEPDMKYLFSEEK